MELMHLYNTYAPSAGQNVPQAPQGGGSKPKGAFASAVQAAAAATTNPANAGQRMSEIERYTSGAYPLDDTDGALEWWKV